MNKILSRLAAVSVALLLLSAGCSSDNNSATSLRPEPAETAIDTAKSDDDCTGFTGGGRASAGSDASLPSGAVKGVVHVFRGSMYFPMTAGAAPRGVSMRVYSRPSSAEPSLSGGEGDFVLELRNKGVGVFEKRFGLSRPALGLNSRPSVIRRDGGSLPVADFKRFTISVVEPTVYDSFAVLWAGREMFTAEKTASAPSVEILGVSEDQVFGSSDVIDLCLHGVDIDSDQLSYRVYYSTDGGDTYRLYSDLSESFSPEVRVRLNSVFTSGGGFVDRLGVAVSDGARTAFAESPSFRILRHESFGVRIISPESGAVLSAGESVMLDARSSIASGNVEFRWRSNHNGNLGVGRTIEFPAGELAVGEHTVTVTATEDSLGLSYVDFVSFFVIPSGVPFKALDDTVHLPPHESIHIDVVSNDSGIADHLDNPYNPYDLKVTVPATLGEASIVDGARGHPPRMPVVSYSSITSGRDSFEYEVCVPDLFCDTATVHISVGLDDCTIFGTEGDDTLAGTPGDDIICALGGDDTIEGLGGDDIIRAGADNDTIFGGAGDDYIQGETGDDTIHGGDGEDLLLGGEGNDALHGGAGYDILGGGNTITEQSKDDKLYFADIASPAVYAELTTEEAELLDAAISTCGQGKPIREVIENVECAQTTNQLCQKTNAGNIQPSDHSEQRIAINSFICETANLTERIQTGYQQRGMIRDDRFGYNSNTWDFRKSLKHDAQVLPNPLVQNNHQIAEATINKLRQLAEAIQNFAIPAYQTLPPPII